MTKHHTQKNLVGGRDSSFEILSDLTFRFIGGIQDFQTIVLVFFRVSVWTELGFSATSEMH